MIANEFANKDFPEELHFVYLEFLGHSQLINKLYYCAPNLSNVFSTIVPALEISKKFENIEDDDEFCNFETSALQGK